MEYFALSDQFRLSDSTGSILDFNVVEDVSSSIALPHHSDVTAMEIDKLVVDVSSMDMDTDAHFEEMDSVEELIISSGSARLDSPPMNTSQVAFHFVPMQTQSFGTSNMVLTQQEKLPVHGQLVNGTRDGFRQILPVKSEHPGPGTMTKPKRTRRSSKGIQGNNKYGRKGQLACAQCRKRKSKCIFDESDPESPCEFCRSRNISQPCIKLRGPKTAVQLASSRALTKYDPSINSRDVHLLQYLYSDEHLHSYSHQPLMLFLRTTSFIYGQSINHIGLRHSILAFITMELDISLEEHLEHANLAIQALCRTLSKPNTLDEGDLFVSFLLTLCCWSLTENAEMMVSANLKGFLSIMHRLRKKVRGAIKSYQLAVFWPLARDLLSLINEHAYGRNLVREFLYDSCQVLGWTNVGQTISYLEALRSENLEDDMMDEIFISPLIHSPTSQCLEMKELLYHKMARYNDQTPHDDPSLRGPLSPSLLEDLHLGTNDEEAVYDLIAKHAAETLMLVENSSNEERDETLVESGEIVWSCRFAFSLRYHRVLRILLQAPTVLEGLTSQEGIDACLRFASTLRDMGGTVFLEDESWNEEMGELTGSEWLQFWKHLVPRANKKFLDSSPWAVYTVGLKREELELALRCMWDDDSKELIDRLFFRFPRIDLRSYTIEEAVQYEFTDD